MPVVSRRALLALSLTAWPLAACSGLGGLSGAAPATPTSAPPAPTSTPAPTPSPTAAPAGAGGLTGRLVAVALAAGPGPKGYTGEVRPIEVTVEKNSGTALRVGFYEDAGSTTGPMWRSSGWIAVVTSAFLLGIDPVNYRYSYEVEELGDGPSASALLTVATAAVLLGDTIKPNATMTGTINPDGTVGFVGGIPHKIDAAAKEKKTLVLIPAGQKKSIDGNTRKEVDVIARGRQQGVEVKEVADVFTAYTLLTGKELPRLPELGELKLALPPGATDRVKARLTDWLARTEEAKKKYQAVPTRFLPPPIHELAKGMMDQAVKAAARATEAQGQGQISSAYAQALIAGTNATIAYYTADVQHAYATTAIGGAINSLKALRPGVKSEALTERLEKIEVKTLGDSLALADAYGNLSLALGLMEIGDYFLEQSTPSKEYTQLKLLISTLIFGMANLAIHQTTDALELGQSLGTLPAPSPEKVQHLAELFRSAAESTLKYFEAVVLRSVGADDDEEEGERQGGLVGSLLIFRDLSYLVARAGPPARKLLEKKTRRPSAKAYAMLGNGLTTYVQSSLLLARFVTLGARYDKSGTMTGFRNEPAMAAMLDLAERRAKQMVGLATRIDAGLPQPYLYWETANVNRGGPPEEKFNALGAYWTAALRGQLIGMLSDGLKLTR